MKWFIFAVRDRMTVSFMTPFFVRHKGEAERQFKDAINDPKTAIARHPEDYDLFELGSFDDGAGLFEVRVPEQVSVGKNVVRASDVSAMQEDAFDTHATLTERQRS